jgi:hypothetical protein
MTAGPKDARIAFQPVAPGAVSACAIRSVSVTATPSAAKASATADLPLPIPPVSPTTRGERRALPVIAGVRAGGNG